MDKFDQQIIKLLTANARQPVTAIGDAIGLSRTAVNDRIRRLEEQGIIRRYTLELGESGEARKIGAYFELTFRPFDLTAVRQQLQHIPGIRQAHALSGNTDVLLFAEAASMEQLNEVRRQLSELPQLEKLVTSTAMETLI